MDEDVRIQKNCEFDQNEKKNLNKKLNAQMFSTRV